MLRPGEKVSIGSEDNVLITLHRRYQFSWRAYWITFACIAIPLIAWSILAYYKGW